MTPEVERRWLLVLVRQDDRTKASRAKAETMAAHRRMGHGGSDGYLRSDYLVRHRWRDFQSVP
jgi:hypothetical protein